MALLGEMWAGGGFAAVSAATLASLALGCCEAVAEGEAERWLLGEGRWSPASVSADKRWDTVNWPLPHALSSRGSCWGCGDA